MYEVRQSLFVTCIGFMVQLVEIDYINKGKGALIVHCLKVVGMIIIKKNSK